MKTHVKLSLAMLTGFGLGAGAVHELRAQATPPAYVISEIDVIDEDGYAHQYIPVAREVLAASGQKRLASGGDTLGGVDIYRSHRMMAARVMTAR